MRYIALLRGINVGGNNKVAMKDPKACFERMGFSNVAKPEYEKVDFYGDLIFWSAPVKTFSRTRWSKIVGTRAYQDVTIRNSNTARKLLELLQGD